VLKQAADHLSGVGSVTSNRKTGTHNFQVLIYVAPTDVEASVQLPHCHTCRNRSAIVLMSTGGGVCFATIFARLTAPLGLFIISCCSSCR